EKIPRIPQPSEAAGMSAELAIQFIRNYTAEPIGEAVAEAASKIGLTVRTEFGAYDNLGAEIAALATRQESPSVVVVTIDLDYFSGGLFSPKWDRHQALDDFSSLLEAVEAVPSRSFVLLSTFVPPFHAPLPWAPEHPVLGKDGIAYELN